MVKVALSYGHGANTYETKHSKFVVVNGKVYEEHTHNWQVGVRVRDILKAHGVEILELQPPNGNDVPLQTRTDKANAWKADLYWSIHSNAGAASAKGWCGFYWKGSASGEKAAKLYAKNVAALGLPLYSGDGIYPSEKGTWSDFHELRESHMPAVLTENGFMTNAEDFKYIFENKDGYYDKVAVAHAKAILEYFGIAYKAPAAPVISKPATPTNKEGWVKEDSIWYFYKDGEKFKGGWLQDKGKWYYLEPSAGRMVVGHQIIGNKPYHFEESGALIITNEDGVIQ